MENKAHSVLSLFSGGGLLDLGFMNLGFQVEKSLELNKEFIKGYNYAFENYINNSDNLYILSGLIKHNKILNEIDLSDSIEQKKLGLEFKNITGLIGGPPCQDYSVGGKNVGADGERGKLIFSYLRLVQLVKPQFIFFENVEGLFKNKKHKERFIYLKERLEAIGYVIWFDVVNSLSYGLPQDRSRLIVVGFRKEIVLTLQHEGFIISKNNDVLKNSDQDNFVFKWPKISFVNPKKEIEWPSAWEFQNHNEENEIQSKRLEAYKELQVQWAFKDLDETFPNQMDRFNPKSSKFWEIPEGDTKRKSFKRLHRYKYSPTVAYGNNEVHLHPIEARRLSVREALRLQTVPDSYVLPSTITLTTKFKMISNGVPTRQAELIASEIRKTLKKYECITNNFV